MLNYQQQVQALSEESRAAYLQIKQELNNQTKEA
jgi:hypothetical protein